tara:strand:- start:73 stop:402 length:330 start_codon:yes stop_codon:yes gene_type:complete
MKIVKNLIETKSGAIECILVLNGKEYPHTMTMDSKYQIHESSEWSDIKPCDPSEKEAHEAKQAQDLINQEAMSYLTKTDWYYLRAIDSGEAVPDEIKLARAAAREKIAV